MIRSKLAAAAGMICLLVTAQACRRIETDARRPGTGLTIVYSSNIMGEIEPCG